jgi:hypothetical protein
MHPVFLQTIYYAVVLILGFLMVSFIQRGFFLKFIKVRLSFGRLVLVKLREVNRDFYAVGEVLEGYLIFKQKKDIKRLTIPRDKKIFYRSMGILWVDVDNERNSIMTWEYTEEKGFDAIKFNDLFMRALNKPSVTDNTTKILIILVCFVALLVIVDIYFDYQTGKKIEALYPLIQQLKQASATITSSNTLT